LTFLTQNINCHIHKMGGSECMLKTGMSSTGVNKAGQSELSDPPQSLKIRMFNQIKNNVPGDINKTVNRIINNLFLIGCVRMHYNG